MALLFSGCAEVPGPSGAEPGGEQARVVLSKDRLRLEAGDQAAVHATVEGLDDKRLIWSATGGVVEPVDGGVIYTAPQQAGEYSLSAVAVSRSDVTASLPIEVRTARENFTIAVIPDTQNMIGVGHANNDMVAVMAQWLVDNAEWLDVSFVTHLGDVVDNGWNRTEWERASDQLGVLDGELPYSVALGDHDYHREEEVNTSTANFAEFFGRGRYQGYDWYGGANPSGTSHFQLFEALDRQFLHVAVEWEARGPATDPFTPLGWARQVIEAHPGIPTIISTHAYLWDEPEQEGRFTEPEGFILEDDGSKTYPGSTGEDLFEALVEPYPQVFMVLNGHYHRAEGTADGEYHQVSSNAAGLQVFEMLSNYQDYPNGGDGWLRLIEFLPGQGSEAPDRITVSTYSPVLDEYQTDARSQFHFDLDFEARFGPASSARLTLP